MKLQKICLHAGLLTVCLFSQGLYAAMANTLELRGKKEPALAGIDVNNISVKVVSNADSNVYSGLFRSIESLARSDIQASCAGLSVRPRQRRSSGDEVFLSINVHIVDLEASRSVCFVQTCLVRAVRLSDGRSEPFKAVVWETPPAVKVFDGSYSGVLLEKTVLEQVKSFAHSYIMSNPVLLSDTAETGTSRDVPEKSKDVNSVFVASKNSQVFHKPSCPFAQKIASKNLVTYGSREEAIGAGKRPCKSCNP